MKKNILTLLAVILLLPYFASAQYGKREYTGNELEGINFADYTTFTWLPFIDSTQTDEFDPIMLDHYITEAVNAQMQERGFTQVEEGGELVLQYLLVLEETRGSKSKPIYGRPDVSLGFGFGSYGGSVGVGVSGPKVTGYEQIPVTYQEGALILGVYDAEMAMTIWRGTISSIREDHGQLINPKIVIAEVIPDLFKEFPKVKRKKEKKK